MEKRMIPVIGCRYNTRDENNMPYCFMGRNKACPYICTSDAQEWCAKFECEPTYGVIVNGCKIHVGSEQDARDALMKAEIFRWD